MNIGVIFAGGTGSRMHSKDKPKQFLEIFNKPIIIYTLEYFEENDDIDAVVIACIEEWIPYLQDLLRKFHIEKVKKIVPGGSTGQMSIYNGLCAARDVAEGSAVSGEGGVARESCASNEGGASRVPGEHDATGNPEGAVSSAEPAVSTGSAVSAASAASAVSTGSAVSAASAAAAEPTIVLIHDGVRPLINKELLSRNIECVRRYGSAITAGVVTETIVVIDENGMVEQVPSRTNSRVAKAPQSFWLDDILKVHEQAQKDGEQNIIDSCTLMARYGYKLHMVDGPYENIKITTPQDFYTMRAILEAKENAQIYGVE